MDRRMLTLFTPSFLIVFSLFLKPSFCANPNYSYQVNIEDPYQANFQQKGETRLGEKAEGFYSVLDPDGRLRTVTYISDEFGFRPTVTYSYPKVLHHQNLLPAAPVLQQALPFYPNAGPGLVKGVTHYKPPLQYAASYATPVFTVKESRQFYKTAPPLLPIVSAQRVFQAPLVPIPVAPKIFQTPLVPVPVAAKVFQAPPVLKQVIKVQPPPPPPALSITKVLEPNGYTYPIPEVKLEYPPPPPALSITKVLEPNGYTYPIPEIKLEYPPPPPATTPAQPILVEKTTQAPTIGYTYPVPEKKFEYPQEAKTEKITSVVAVPLVPEAVVQAVPTKVEPDVIEPIAVAPAPIPLEPQHPIPARIIQAQPPQPAFQYLNFGTRIPKVPQQVVYAAGPPPPPPALVPQPIIYHQPKFHYTQNPAQVFHRQLHFPRIQHLGPQVIQAVAPPPPPPKVIHAVEPPPPPPQPTFVHSLPPPPPPPVPLVEHRYEDIVSQNLNLMRYGTASVSSYLPPLREIEAISPAVGVGVIPKRPTNPLTFNYGYDNGISKVSHSYYGSGW